MITKKIYQTLSFLSENFKKHNVNWVLIGSLNLFLQGVDVEFHDIDIYTDKVGTFCINKIFKNYEIEPIKFSEIEIFRSYRGIFKINNCLVDVVTDLKFRPSKTSKWFKSSGLSKIVSFKYRNLRLHLASLNEEYVAYINMGRLEKARKIKERLQQLGVVV
jgi:hypothetical protein